MYIVIGRTCIYVDVGICERIIMKNKVATTVKVESSLYDEFKVLGVRHKITLQRFIERTIYRYVNEPSFRDGINNFILPVTTSKDVEPITVISSSLN